MKVYENKTYEVIKLAEPVTDDGLVYNWAVVNKEFQTTEARTGVLPEAIAVADQLDKYLSELSTSEPVLNLVH